MNAISLLKQDHDELGKFLKELTATTPRGVKTRHELLGKIKQALQIHIQIENEIFYPAFKKAGKTSNDDKMVYEALEEHRAAGELVLIDLLHTKADGEEFGGRAKVLKELIEHHVKEEEKTMFPRAKELLSEDKLTKLGDALKARKSALKSPAQAA